MDCKTCRWAMMFTEFGNVCRKWDDLTQWPAKVKRLERLEGWVEEVRVGPGWDVDGTPLGPVARECPEFVSETVSERVTVSGKAE